MNLIKRFVVWYWNFCVLTWSNRLHIIFNKKFFLKILIHSKLYLKHQESPIDLCNFKFIFSNFKHHAGFQSLFIIKPDISSWGFGHLQKIEAIIVLFIRDWSLVTGNELILQGNSYILFSSYKLIPSFGKIKCQEIFVILRV